MTKNPSPSTAADLSSEKLAATLRELGPPFATGRFAPDPSSCDCNTSFMTIGRAKRSKLTTRFFS
jgi:hypothetical protein